MMARSTKYLHCLINDKITKILLTFYFLKRIFPLSHNLLLQSIIYVKQAVIRAVPSNNAQFNYQRVTLKAHGAAAVTSFHHDNIQFRQFPHQKTKSERVHSFDYLRK